MNGKAEAEAARERAKARDQTDSRPTTQPVALGAEKKR